MYVMIGSTLLIILVLLGGMGFYFLVLVRRWHITHLHRSWITTLYFLSLTGGVTYFFFDIFSRLAMNFLAIPFSILGGLVIFSLLAYWYIRHTWVRPDAFLRRHSAQNFLQIEYQYLLGKGAEILFQQAGVIVLVALWSEHGLSLAAVTFLFPLLFGFLHLGLFFTGDRRWALYYTSFSVIGGFLFPLLILTVPSGYVYSFIIHWLFYTLSGAVFWVYHQPRSLSEGRSFF